MKICKMMYLNTGPRLQRLIGNVTVLMAHGSQCHAIRMNTTVEIQELKELKTIQEEAGTRMLLHAAHASKTWTNIVMSPDTDVFVLALFVATSM